MSRPTTGCPIDRATKRVADRLQYVIDGCILGLLWLAPLCMGGRGEVGQLAFVGLAGLGTMAWLVRKTWVDSNVFRRSGVEWLLLCGAGVVVAQLIPLPRDWLDVVSPAIRELLPMWGAGSPVHLGEWATVSLTPGDTRAALTVYLAYALFFTLLIQRLDHLSDVQKLLRWIAAASVFMSVVGLAQFFSGDSRYLWVYERVDRSACSIVRGTFQNENHFVHFLSLGVGPLLWWLWHVRQTGIQPASRGELRKHDRASAPSPTAAIPVFWRQLLLLSGLILIGLGGLLSFSRGGVLILTSTFAVAVGVYYWRSLIDRRTASLLAGAGAVVGCSLLVFGFRELSQELGTIWNANSAQELLAGRIQLWGAMWEGITRFYWTGTGVGSHRYVYPVYMAEHFDVEFTHGESGYLPVLLETGVGGLGLVLTGIGCATTWCWRTMQRSSDTVTSSRSPGASRNREVTACVGAVIPGLLASCVHSIADFVWYIPACMTMTVALLACACRLHQLTRHSASMGASAGSSVPTTFGHRRSLRPMWGMATMAIGCLVALMCQACWGPALAVGSWEKYLRLTLPQFEKPENDVQRRDHLAQIEQNLIAVLQHTPNDARAHLRLASNYVQQFALEQRLSDNSLDLAQICDAALASQFKSRAAQDEWLTRALGNKRELLDRALRHGHQAVALSPLLGVGYLELSNLCFLESPRAGNRKAYLAQAALVRPYDSRVLMVLGKEAAVAGDQDGALQLWRRAFQQDAEVRQQLIDSLADQVPAGMFIEMFAPDTYSLGQLWQRYQRSGLVEDAKYTAQKFVAGIERQAAESTYETASGYWAQAREVYTWLGESDDALRCQEQAVQCDPNNFQQRWELAKLLVRHQRLEEAVRHYDWCSRRQPDDERIQHERSEAEVLRRASQRMASEVNPPLR